MHKSGLMDFAIQKYSSVDQYWLLARRKTTTRWFFKTCNLNAHEHQWNKKWRRAQDKYLILNDNNNSSRWDSRWSPVQILYNGKQCSAGVLYVCWTKSRLFGYNTAAPPHSTHMQSRTPSSNSESTTIGIKRNRLGWYSTVKNLPL